jgi:hypothetical protein
MDKSFYLGKNLLLRKKIMVVRHFVNGKKQFSLLMRLTTPHSATARFFSFSCYSWDVPVVACFSYGNDSRRADPRFHSRM